jgi:hypothetical protein
MLFSLCCVCTGFDFLSGKEQLWGYIKNQMYSTVVTSLQNLKECIDVEGIPSEKYIITFWVFEYQMAMVWTTDGVQIEVY